jgi:hypothetical protein
MMPARRSEMLNGYGTDSMGGDGEAARKHSDLTARIDGVVCRRPWHRPGRISRPRCPRRHVEFAEHDADDPGQVARGWARDFGLQAKLQRKSDRLKLRVETAQLDPGETLDVFWAVFNNPSACINGNPITGVPCGPAAIVCGTGAFEGLRGSGEMEVVNDPDDDSLAHVTFTGPVTR